MTWSTKTTGGLIVLPRDHYLMTRRTRSHSEMHQIGKSACDQCSYCTEFARATCWGTTFMPHKVMRSLGIFRHRRRYLEPVGRTVLRLRHLHALRVP